MAISPKDALKARAEQVDISSFVEIIDDWLTSDKSGFGLNLGSLSHDAIVQITRAYREAGWTVRWEHTREDDDVVRMVPDEDQR